MGKSRQAVQPRRKKKTQGTRQKDTISIDLQRKKNYKALVSQIKRELGNPDEAAIPNGITPMLATLGKEPFNDAGWIFEIKWDGYRSIATVNDGKVQLRSRNNISFNQTYSPIAEALSQWPVNAVIDGEITVVNEEGKADFEALQNWGTKEAGQLVYYVFDILWLDGVKLEDEPLEKRKSILARVLPEHPMIRLSDSIDEFGIDFYKVAKENELEGIVGKNRKSVYRPGKRTTDWLKFPTEVRQEFVIGGWAESDSGRPFKSLLFGYHENGKLVYVGHAGGGYRESEMKGMLQKLEKLEIKKSPFINEVESDTKVHWVRPQLVAEIKYASFTSAGKIRKPAIFLGFRKDKDASEVIKEITPDTGKNGSKKTLSENRSVIADTESNWKKIERQKTSSSTVHTFEGKEVTLTNIERKLWGDFTKAHLLMYYHSIYPFIYPHLNNRPLSLHLKPDGPSAPGFYIKDMENRQPEWAEIYSVKRKHKAKDRRDVIDYIVCQDEATLQYIINLGCIDVNPWTSTIHHPQQPDYIIIDLDPSDDDFSKAIETAKAAKEYFIENKITAFAKTSGKTGIHLYLPCTGFDFTQARSIAENICKEIHESVPSITTTEVSIDLRRDKLYIDPNQNDFADTVAAPYSMRPYHQPRISVPLDWKEINSSLDPSSFTIPVLLKRLEKKGDLFTGVLDKKIANKNSVVLRKFV